MQVKILTLYNRRAYNQKLLSLYPLRKIHILRLNDFPIFVISGEIPLVDIFEEIGHAIAYNKDSDVLSDDILSGIIFGKDINIEAFSIKFEEAGYDINGNNRMFMINIHSDNKIENFDYDFIMNKLRDSFAQNNGSLILSRYANNIVGCFNCLENADDTHGLINQSYEALSGYNCIYKKEINNEWMLKIKIGIIN